MVGLWIRTWHEDKEISPGVPDLSYVMLGGTFETGWIELKAENESKWVKFRIEPSQHQWIRNHHNLIPVHFLVAVGDDWYLIPGNCHEELAKKMSKLDLAEMAVYHARYPLTTGATLDLVHLLKSFTGRVNGNFQRV